MTPTTLQQIADQNGLSCEALRKRISRSDLAIKWDKNRPLSAEEADAVRGLLTDNPKDKALDTTPDKARTERRTGEKVGRGQIAKKTWPLWLCLSFSMGCSIPNMVWVAHQLKADIIQAYLVTAAFTVAPFLLLYYGVRKWLKWVPYVPVLAEVICNAAGFYGGMTGLGKGLYVTPTPFLHMFTSMVNSGNEGTALLLSLFFAVCIALLAVVPVIELEKK